MTFYSKSRSAFQVLGTLAILTFTFPAKAQEGPFHAGYAMGNKSQNSQAAATVAGRPSPGSLKDCGDGDCDYGEDSNNCAIDCKSAPAGNFACDLKFFQLRFAGKQPKVRPVTPRMPEFVIGDPYGNLEQYEYILLVSAFHYDLKINHSYIDKYTVALSRSEIRRIFADRLRRFGDNTVPLYLLQDADIQKIHIMLWPGKESPKYGVKLNMDGSYVLVKGALSPDSPLKDYQQGRTVVIPAIKFGRFRPVFNLNTPAVKEYWIRVGLKAAKKSKSNAVHIDTATVSYGFFYHRKTHARYHYISNGNEAEQSRHYITQLMDTVVEMKKRNKGIRIILNNWYPERNIPYRIAANEVFVSDKYFPYIDGMTIDNAFEPKEVEWHLDTIRKAKKNNTKMLYMRNKQTKQASSYVYRLWLWYHLIADENTFFYVNDTYANKRMINYPAYGYPLGHALEKPHKEGNLWIRKYERGTIYYDVGPDDLDGIYFIEHRN